jgi:hypothetical protein
MERISELGTTFAVTSNWSTLRWNTNYMERISELGTTLAVTSNWSTVRWNTNYMERISELGTTLAVTSNWSTLRDNISPPLGTLLHWNLESRFIFTSELHQAINNLDVVMKFISDIYKTVKSDAIDWYSIVQYSIYSIVYNSLKQKTPKTKSEKYIAI